MSNDIHNLSTSNAKPNSILSKDRTSMVENAFKLSPARSWNELSTDYRYERSAVDQYIFPET